MEITEWLGHGLIFFFTQIPLIGDAMAAFLAVVLIGTAFAISYRYKREHHQPLAAAIEARVRLIDEVTGGSMADADSARLAFARRFNDIDEQMMEAPHLEVLSLRRTWEEYRETIVDPGANVLQNAGRPEHFFVNIGEHHRGLNWFANIFIAIGLLITFLGIIAALSTLDFSGGVDAMQERLNELMIVGPVTVRSACSHHLCPILGKVWIGVLPNEHSNLIGLSKYSRICDWIMSRPQIQE